MGGPSGARRLLIVDDDPAVLSVTETILKRQGFEVLTATHAAQALQIVKEHTAEIDMVISDVHMPQMSGPDLVRRVRQITPETKCALMSGYVDGPAEHHGLPLIMKPFTPSSLVASIQDLLGA
jgi:DNA-binding NtrC family response regulator